MEAEEEAINPYALAISDDHEPFEQSKANEPRPPRRSWLQSILVWSAVCIISAAPSFFWGLTIANNQILAMATGIAIFIAAYTIADQITQRHPWRARRIIRQVLKTGYISRIVITVIFPVGAWLDMICGLFSVGLTNRLRHSNWGDNFPRTRDGQDAMTFVDCLLTTLIQGVLLNLVLLAYMLVIAAMILSITQLQRSWPSQDPPPPTE
ncbi:hypothetical protein [Aureliella helgolandensis]|uniref:Uncharacterized protein n=1 Tax=Aureliella helgolandensis TaxID=2527968 RepID=A0A518GEQ0_9BACT|nr:hypothetical protein [Aureliella helgolandensis]QDV27072.1 hypothetical protein Q31a_54530 [Aureliella helgolandensis]